MKNRNSIRLFSSAFVPIDNQILMKYLITIIAIVLFQATAQAQLKPIEAEQEISLLEMEDYYLPDHYATVSLPVAANVSRRYAEYAVYLDEDRWVLMVMADGCRSGSGWMRLMDPHGCICSEQDAYLFFNRYIK